MTNRLIHRAKGLILTILAVCVMSSAGWATNYYVDATNGNDSNDGSQANPWQTISKVESGPIGGYQPGDVVKFKKGETWQGQLDIPASNITISCYGNGKLPIIDANNGHAQAISIYNKSNVVIEYIQAQNVTVAGWSIKLTGSTDCTIRYCEVYEGGTNTGEYGCLRVSSDCSGCEIHNNTIGKNTGNPGSDRAYSGFDAMQIEGTNTKVHHNTINHTTREDGEPMAFYSHGIQIGNISGTVEIYSNTIYHTGSHGIYFRQTSGSYTLKIYRNTISYTGQAGISIYECWSGGTGYIYENEVSYANRLSGVSGQGGNSSCGIHLSNGYSPSGEFDTWYVYDNIVHDCQAAYDPNCEDSGGIAIDYNANGVKCYRNVCYDNYGKGIYIFNADNCDVYYNILWGNDSGIVCSTVGGNQTANNNKIYGNVLYKNYNGSPGPDYDCEILFGLRDKNTVIKNNILYAHDSGKAYRFYDTSTSGGQCDSNIVYKENNLSSICWTNGANQSWSIWTWTHSDDLYAGGFTDINDDPDFNDPSSSDFTLQGNSPAIDAGKNLGSPFQWAIDPRTLISDWPNFVDTLDQNQYGDGWEIGAFVYLGKVDPVPPDPPQGVIIIE